jgi:hypothetical protein
MGWQAGLAVMRVLTLKRHWPSLADAEVLQLPFLSLALRLHSSRNGYSG